MRGGLLGKDEWLRCEKGGVYKKRHVHRETWQDTSIKRQRRNKKNI